MARIGGDEGELADCSGLQPLEESFPLLPKPLDSPIFVQIDDSHLGPTESLDNVSLAPLSHRLKDIGQPLPQVGGADAPLRSKFLPEGLQDL